MSKLVCLWLAVLALEGLAEPTLVPANHRLSRSVGCLGRPSLGCEVPVVVIEEGLVIASAVVYRSAVFQECLTAVLREEIPRLAEQVGPEEPMELRLGRTFSESPSVPFKLHLLWNTFALFKLGGPLPEGIEPLPLPERMGNGRLTSLAFRAERGQLSRVPSELIIRPSSNGFLFAKPAWPEAEALEVSDLLFQRTSRGFTLVGLPDGQEQSGEKSYVDLRKHIDELRYVLSLDEAGLLEWARSQGGFDPDEPEDPR